ncbi:MAG: MmgE/PrpD family protein [Pseudomonadota bacterium]
MSAIPLREPSTRAAVPVAHLPDTISHRLGAFVVATTPAALPAHVVALAKDRLLDALATAFAARKLAVPGVARAFVAQAGSHSGAATVIGHAGGLPAIDAAFVNATLVNGCTHDDFLAKSHAGAVAIPAALAVAEEEGASGAELLAGIVVGYDTCARAWRGGPGMLPRFRASGVAGAVGAAGAAARLKRLTAEQASHALGLSAMFASGFGAGFHSGTMDVKLNVGWACRSGVSAAQLAFCGATAAPHVFEGTAGFFEAFANSAEHAQEAVRGLGERFLIEDTVYKERPVCIFVQTPVQLARNLVAEHGLDPAAIERVRIRAPLATLTNPGYQNLAPFATQLQARISARFTVAAALLGRPVESYKYFDHTDDAEVLALAERVELLPPGTSEDDVWVQVQMQVGGAVRTVETTGREMDHLLPTTDKVIAKYQRLMADLPAVPVQRLLDTVMAIDRLADVRELGAQLRAL